MKARPRTVLLATTSLLTSTAELEAAIGRYVETISRKDGLTASRVVLDSEECRAAYGVRLADPSSWEEIRSVLASIVDRTGPCYIILLGGPEVLPVPQMVTVWALPGICLQTVGTSTLMRTAWWMRALPSAACPTLAATRQPWLRLCRAPATFTRREASEWSRRCFSQRAAGLLRLRAWATPVGMMPPTCGNCYATPPYGVCDECEHRAEMFDQISRSDYIFIMGHGSPVSFATNDHIPIFNLENVADVDLSGHPIISGWVSCNTGQLYADRPSFSTELLRAEPRPFWPGQPTRERLPTLRTSSSPTSKGRVHLAATG